MPPARPMTPFAATAAMRVMPVKCPRLHRDLRLDMWMRFVALEREILVVEGKNISNRGIEAHARQRARRACELQPRLLDVVEIEVRVPERVDELARLIAGHLRHHQGEQRIGGDIERHAEEDVGRALIELARELSPRDIELEQAMAWRQRHPLDVSGIPGGDDQPA